MTPQKQPVTPNPTSSSTPIKQDSPRESFIDDGSQTPPLLPSSDDDDDDDVSSQTATSPSTNQPSSSNNLPVSTRAACPYGENCYR